MLTGGAEFAGLPCESFPCWFKGVPEGPLALPTWDGAAGLRWRSARLDSGAARLARQAKTGAAETGEVVQAAADLTRGPLRSTWEGRPIAGKPTAADPVSNP
jgi:hypothetical protein